MRVQYGCAPQRRPPRGSCRAATEGEYVSLSLIVIAEESRTHTVLSGKYLHLRQIKCSQYLILLRIFSLHLRNICSRKTALHPPALNFLMDFVKASRSKIRILQDEIWRKTRKILATGRMSSALFGYTRSGNLTVSSATPLQSLRDSFPSGDAFAAHVLLVHVPIMVFLP